MNVDWAGLHRTELKMPRTRNVGLGKRLSDAGSMWGHFRCKHSKLLNKVEAAGIENVNQSPVLATNAIRAPKE